MMSKTIKPSHPENLLNDRELNLRCRLAQAMLKAGFADDAVTVTCCLDTGSHDDVSSIIVIGTDGPIVARAAVWIKKALDQAGVKMTRSGGSWGRGINEIGPVKVVHGKYSRVVCHYSSIGELVNVTFTREK